MGVGVIHESIKGYDSKGGRSEIHRRRLKFMVGGSSILYPMSLPWNNQTEKKGLTIFAASSNEHTDQLIGAGCVDRIESSYNGFRGIRAELLLPESNREFNTHKVEIEDYTNFTMMARFMAGSLGILMFLSIPWRAPICLGILPGRVKIRLNSWRSFWLRFWPCISAGPQPEVGYFHVQRADKEGNCQMWGILGDAPWSVRSCKKSSFPAKK